MYRFLLICLLICLAGLAHAQTPAAILPATQLNLAKPAPKRQLQAVRVSTAPKMDGVLDEAVWQSAPVATDFYELEPTPGPIEKHKTEVRVLYDDAALYIGAVMHDVSADSILHQLSERDDFGNTDFFGVFIDTYNDHLNGYEFLVSSGGVQADSRLSPTNGEDGNWNAVWESRTVMSGTDWVAELRIPFSAIRFSSAAALKRMAEKGMRSSATQSVPTRLVRLSHTAFQLPSSLLVGEVRASTCTPPELTRNS